MHVTLEPTVDPAGVRIVDPIERRQMDIRTSGPVEIDPRSTDGFSFPVDTAGVVETDELRFDRLDDAYVRDAEWDLVAAFTSPETVELDPGSYTLEISGPIKLYCRVDSAVTVKAGIDSFVVAFPGDRQVTLGARSYHKHPATTITTPDDPRETMKAIEATSSALKTTTCERAYPTLRGHPPLLERGDELSIPDGVSAPETGVTIVLPPDRRYLYTAAPLAFYLGADLIPGQDPRIETPAVTHPLGTNRAFEDEVARTLKRTLFLDAIVRTEGIYEVEQFERRQVEPHLPFDVESLYDEPLHEQLGAYLEVPYERIADHVPTWVLTAHLPSTPASVEALPFVLNDLGVVREPRGAEYDRPEAIIDDYSPVNPRSTDDRSSTGGSGAPSSNPASDTGNREWTLVEPVPTDESVDHVWFGRGVPVGASKGTLEAFRNRLDQQEERTDAIDITVVCNDERMLDEHESLEAVYGRREDFPFEVTSHFGLSREGFATLLERDDSDFLHYIGHATPEGLRCSDGKLDVRDLDSVGVDVFFLNACDSYEQALALTERGALGGVGTLGDVVNAYAIEAGKLTAKLLNQGFPLRAAITLVRENTVIGDQYLVVGDGSVDVAQPEGGAPTVYHVETRDDGDYAVEATAYPTRVFRIGTYFDVTAESFDDKFLLPGTTKPMRMTESELNEYFRWFSGPVRIDGQLRWMDSLESPL